jgi:uncharacterized protein YukE
MNLTRGGAAERTSRRRGGGRHRAETKELAALAADASSGVFDTMVAAEVAAAHAHDVAEAAGRVAGRVSEVSSVVGQLEAAVGEISQSTHAAAAVVDSVGTASTEAVALLRQLGEATDEIVAMVDFVRSIAEQTDLLALNATIEAARAGEAGRGFGVVASEVKELATATAEATTKITAIVARLRNEANAALSGVDQIANLVDGFSNQHAAIAAAVEEQATATADITRTLANAATDIDEVADGVESLAAQTYEATVAASMTKQAVSRLGERLDSEPVGSTDQLLGGLAAHSDWKARLVRAIETSSTELSVATVRASDKCVFGQWLHHTIDPADRASSHYGEVVELHARFHEHAADVLDLAQRAQVDAAKHAIAPGSAYAGVSAALAGQIITWRSERR